MKILIVNTNENRGGAAIAANRLHCSLRKFGVNSTMLVLAKDSSDEHVVLVHNNRIKNKICWEINALIKRHDFRMPVQNSEKTYFSNLYSCNHIKRHIKRIDPDIIHLHWVNDNLFNLGELRRIGRPVVWSLHDMWPFTGGCHYDCGCGRFRDDCGRCPLLNSDQSDDITNKIYRKKKQLYGEIKPLYILGLSRWICDSAKTSSLLSECKIKNIPNCIDTKKYRQGDRIVLRDDLGVSNEKTLVLFGGVDGVGDPRKGFSYLIDALMQLDPAKYELAIFGSNNVPEILNSFKVHNLGFIRNVEKMVGIYSCADILVLPSIQENLSNVVMESLACSTPVVAFDIGGNRDMIKHKHNGYLAKIKSAKSLAEGIEWLALNDLRENARCFVQDHFAEDVVIPQYINFYRDLLN